MRPGTEAMGALDNLANSLRESFSFALGLLLSNNSVALGIHVAMIFSLVMSMFYLSSFFLYSWSISVHSSGAMGSGFPNFSINTFPLVVIDGG